MPDTQVSMDTLADPFARFDEWFAEAKRREISDPNAMTVATCTADGMPSARIVLLKAVDPSGADPRGFVFYTNKQSRKGGELNANRHAALLFHWKTLQRQVRVEGVVSDVSEAEADAYYDSRARISRLGAWASEQSRELPGRAELERRVAEYDARFPEGSALPRPPHWSGYRVTPSRIEFWQDMPFRLHDRTIYVPAASGWTTHKLYP